MDVRDTQDQRNEAIVQEHMEDESQQPVNEEPSLNDVEMLPVDHSTSMSGIEASSVPAPPALTSSVSMPESSPIRRSVRRSRVEDDHDDERDRRHPTERLIDPSRSATPVSQSASEPHLHSATPWRTMTTRTESLPLSLPGISSFLSGPTERPGASAPSSSRPFRFFQHMMPPDHPNNPNPAAAAAAVASGPQQQPLSTTTATVGTGGPTPRRNPIMEGFAMIFNDDHVSTTPLFSNSDTRTTTHRDAADPPTQGPTPADGEEQAVPANEQGPDQPQPTPGSQRSLFLGLLAALNSLNDLVPFERDIDDPERAKKLVAGLEEVPSGLVRRLERVGGTGGGMGEELTSGGDSGCAICWDKLLPEVDENIEGEKKDVKEGTEESKTTMEPEEKCRRVVSLPCAHVFHADCLIPWFSRPKQTTCPTCRFNIDPENITYTSRAQRRQQQGNRAQLQTPAQNAANVAPQPVPQESNTTPTPQHETGSLSFPLFFSGTLPGVNMMAPVPQNPPSTEGGQPQPQPPPQPQPSEGDEQRPEAQDGDSDNGGNGPRHFVTIGFDLYIGPGAPPINRPVPPGSEEPEAGTTEANAIPIPTTGDTEGDSATRPDSQPSGNRPPNQRSVPLGSGYIPIPVGRGTINDIFQRIFGAAMNERRTTSNQPPATGGPPVFGPERPPAPESAAAPASNGATGTPQQLSAAPFPLPFGLGSPQAPTQPHSQSQPQSPTQPTEQPSPQTTTTTTQTFILEDVPLMELLNLAFRPPGGTDGPRPQTQRGPTQQAPRTPKNWTPPPAPGLTLRQRIEKKEQEAGLRCCDFSCGVGPSDEDPWVYVTDEGMKQLNIHDDGKDAFACPHTFHSSCLVSSERVSLALRNAEVAFEVGPEGKEKVEVSCPVCRGVGKVSRKDWEEGVQALD